MLAHVILNEVKDLKILRLGKAGLRMTIKKSDTSPLPRSEKRLNPARLRLTVFPNHML